MLILLLLVTPAPFYPDSHLLSRTTWALYGAEGMQVIDFIDWAFHFTPVVLAVRWWILFKWLKLPQAADDFSA